MAKKKKQTRRQDKKNDQAEVSSFWPLTGAVLLLVLAVFILIGGFGTGGSLPINLFKGTYWALGWVAYLAPVALAFWGIQKFMSQDFQIPLAKLVSMVSFLILFAAWAHVTFVTRTNGVSHGGHGGSLGAVIGDTLLHVIDKLPASLLLFVFSLLAVLLSFGISPNALIKVFGLFKRPPKEDTDLEVLKKAGAEGFKLNEGVPVIHGGRQGEQAPSRLSDLKNTAQKLMPEQSHQALTVASDPEWKFPSIDLLNQKQDKADPGDVKNNAEIIQETFAQFNYQVAVEGANVGPRVTQYTLKPPSGVKLDRLMSLEKNLTLNLAAHSLRMEAPIPGTRSVGIEVPNKKSATVTLHSILNSSQWASARGPLYFAVGKDIAGNPLVADLEDMPHLLIAGQTKAGKSVMINTLLASFLYRNSPSDLKLILIDPKHVEMAPYEDIPHLIAPVITEPERCISALKWAVAEMERRLKAFAEVKQRDIEGYNRLKSEERMPSIVVVIDELADLMMMAPRDVEALIARIAQKARAAGIHLVLATQRPDANVVTGIIKANVPARLAFAVQDQINSRIIIDQMGAEKLLGKGDMLYKTTDINRPIRMQGALISGEETNKLCDFLRAQRTANYNEEVISQPVQISGRGGVVADYGSSDMDDDLWRDAIRVVIEGHKASTSLLQRRLRVGYARAARLIETMEEQGIVGPADGSRPREVLVSSLEEVFNRPQTNTADEVNDENFPADAPEND